MASADFVLTATHTRNGPVVNADVTAYTLYNITSSQQLARIDSYAGWVGDRIVALVRTTLAAPARRFVLDYRVAAQSFSSNRELMRDVETEVPVLVARSLAGDPLSVLFGYGCHPVAAPKLTEFDADYPGRAVAVIEQKAGAFARFLPGAAGDQNPRGRGQMGECGVRRKGLGGAVVEAIGSPGRPVSGSVASAYRELEVPLELPQDLAGFREKFVARQADLGMFGWARRHAEVVIGQIDADSYATSTVVPWHYASGWSLGYPDIGGGAMCCYDLIGHFRGRGQDGAVESTILDGLAAVI